MDKVEKLDSNAIANEGFEEMKQILSMVDNKYIKIDLSTARGLAYYTGTVFEIFDKKGEFRSLAGGGRYDNLVELLGGEPSPATGFAIGLATLSLLLKKRGLVPKISLAPEYYVAIVGDNIRPKAMKIVAELRKKYTVETDFMRRNISKQLDYANTLGAKNVVVIGENEIKSGKVKVKDMKSGDEVEKLVSQL